MIGEPIEYRGVRIEFRGAARGWAVMIYLPPPSGIKHFVTDSPDGLPGLTEKAKSVVDEFLDKQDRSPNGA